MHNISYVTILLWKFFTITIISSLPDVLLYALPYIFNEVITYLY